MNPDDMLRKARESKMGQRASQAHSAVDRAYQSLTRPDRPLEPETHKMPWLAGLLSFFFIGAGQLYNRQMLKAVLLFLVFYGGGLLLLIAYLLVGFWEAALPTRADLAYVALFVWGGLWLFAVIDAYRTAWMLKTGKLVIRYGFLRQSVFAAASMIPVAGALAPSESVAPDEVNKSVGEVATDLAKEKLVKWLLIRFLRFICLGLGVILVIVALVWSVPFLLTLGGLVLLGGILLFLV